MASCGHSSTQVPQSTHSAGLILATSSSIVITSVGHTSTHAPQPTHFSSSTTAGIIVPPLSSLENEKKGYKCFVGFSGSLSDRMIFVLVIPVNMNGNTGGIYCFFSLKYRYVDVHWRQICPPASMLSDYSARFAMSYAFGHITVHVTGYLSNNIIGFRRISHHPHCSVHGSLHRLH